MYQIIKFLSADGNLPGDNSGDNAKKDIKNEDLPENSELKKDHPHKETVIDKIKDALQDWSNDNEKDIDEDDHSALRSGL